MSIYKDIEEMVVDMCILCDELRNKEQEYNIIPSDMAMPGEHHLGFIVWWGIKNLPSGVIVEEISESFKVQVPILNLAEVLTQKIFKSKETREAFIHCLKNGDYPVDKEKIQENRESKRILSKGW